MNTVQKQPWANVRMLGRDRFLLRSIVLAARVFAVVSVVIHLGLFAFTQRHLEPLLQTVVTWAFMSMAFGAGMGLYQWKGNEDRIVSTKQVKRQASGVGGGISAESWRKF